MSGDSDLIKLYSTRILALAADMPNTDRLAAPDATSKKRAPLCGSTVTVDIEMRDGKIAAFGQDVKACALGQAAASIVGGHAIGCRQEDIQAGRDALKHMLQNQGPTPAAPFEELEVLRAAQDFKNRHASILLAFEATLDAMDQAKQIAR